MLGFVVVNEVGEKVILGCNGLDYFVVVLVVCIDVECCEIWIDVDGVYNVDLNQVEGVVLFDKLIYQEVMELFYFGVKVLYFKIIGLIVQYYIFCLIKNIFNFSVLGILISNEVSIQWISVKGILQFDNIVMFNVVGLGMKGMVGMVSCVFEVMFNVYIFISLIMQFSLEYLISFCISSKDVQCV